MYLSHYFDEKFESIKDNIIGNRKYTDIIKILNSTFPEHPNLSFKKETYPFFKKDRISISGLYDMEDDKMYIVLNLSNNHRTFNTTEKAWNDIKFSLSQVCQHEYIHKLQWQNREGIVVEKPLEFRINKTSKYEEQEYLSDADEIDAYAHDIAMEIKHYYPKQNPYHILRTLNARRKLQSYTLYKRTFKDTQWDCIRKRLYTKIYKWLAFV